jgi:hypothetical protein
MVKINFKTPVKEQAFDLELNLETLSTVLQLKQLIADHKSTNVANI